MARQTVHNSQLIGFIGRLLLLFLFSCVEIKLAVLISYDYPLSRFKVQVIINNCFFFSIFSLLLVSLKIHKLIDTGNVVILAFLKSIDDL